MSRLRDCRYHLRQWRLDQSVWDVWVIAVSVGILLAILYMQACR